MTNVDPKHVRDIAGDRKAAMIDEYENYVRGGRTDDAEDVAAELKLMYGLDVAKPAKPEKVDKPAEPPVERAVPTEQAETPEKPEEPARRGPGRPRKTTE